ncbi:NadS family protein [Kingella oralis]|uniref:NadS family protein n=1 Tax=Kingella oralis TaxID=505 RepID=UPI002D801A7C|nr:NadS family protein [Kingella oralis]
MEKQLFTQLLQSAQEMVEIEQGLREPAAVHILERPDPREIRKTLHQTQAEFAQTLGVSTSLAQSWEQNRRIPEGTSLKILRVLAKQPEWAAVFQAA